MSVGLTEAKAKAAGREVKVGRFPFVGNGKAMIAEAFYDEHIRWSQSAFPDFPGGLLSPHLTDNVYIIAQRAVPLGILGGLYPSSRKHRAVYVGSGDCLAASASTQSALIFWFTPTALNRNSSFLPAPFRKRCAREWNGFSQINFSRWLANATPTFCRGALSCLMLTGKRPPESLAKLIFAGGG